MLLRGVRNIDTGGFRVGGLIFAYSLALIWRLLRRHCRFVSVTWNGL